ncbi:isoleucine--tRNA ligase [Fusibacter tunisiensis]|uniref:Isoleucine--tRNA ligase n=1 Tax=Fusibacter tunisiensis TaxID=1008308 RepID=A0ABS2MM92_9FIRM|nr:isoleucine--tRNA ligase [Fusibacter tunisiensis]MBM7560517.1 isoleucyl-tRNA synthetase [Fusibacter tunisiensis]
MSYKELSKGVVSDHEKQIRTYWEDIDLLKLSIDSREGKEPFIFYEGPPTANGRPGIHHVLARALKDAVCRYKTMQGYQVKRKAGWDTHGLPVEIEVEKKLNLNDKSQIEAYGIENFNHQCKASVFEYEDTWREMTKKMAYLIDLDHPYITLENNYIESEWWILDKFFKEGYIYEGHKILPYCPRCGTGLASHEVAQGYQEIKTVTVYVKFKRKGYDEYFLVWTTTPWTLASNVALTVNANETYVKVRHNDTVYYVEKNLAPQVLEGDYEVLEEMKGKSLEYMEYEQLMPFIAVDKKAFFVTCADYVTVEDGTGIVHTAPAFGEDDYNTGVRYNLPVIQPVDEEGRYTETPWKGQFVMDADPEIVNWLGENGILYRKQKMDHNYPHCWRCRTPLLYYAKPSWYIEMTKLKDQLIANNNSVNWFPDYVGEKRFGNWLENLNDWAISRSRYWGTPLNIWRCDCGHLSSVGSREELKDRAIEDIDIDIELHRPYVDDVHLTCDKCGGVMTRVPDVIDCWFDSGAMPFAQHHYPFENKESFDSLYPADFICEGIDQTRGWFYSLIAISTFVMGKAPYKNVLVNDLVLDKHGKKMSKSRGNTVDAFKLLDSYGADVVRWYLYYVSPAWTPTKFDEDGLAEVASKFFGTFKNVYNFFTLYANTDGINVLEFDVPETDRSELDQWILSKLHTLIKGVQLDLEVFDSTKAVRKIQEFVSEDLSNWYIRRSRRRFWDSELSLDKKSVYKTTYEVLVAVSQLAAPFAPYLSEEIYRNLTGEVSVHVSHYPQINETLIQPRIEDRMDLVRDLVTLGRAARESVKIKVRQPIAEVIVDGKHEDLIGDLVPLIEEELNVKHVKFTSDLPEYMNFMLKPNFKVLGPILGNQMGQFSKALGKLDPQVYAMRFEAGETVELDLGDERFIADSSHVLINITAKEGFTVKMENNRFIILDTHLSDALIDEGYAREMISRIQQMRKANDYEMMDQIKIYYRAPEAFGKAVQKHADYILSETLGVDLIQDSDQSYETFNLNGHDVDLYLEKNA